MTPGRPGGGGPYRDPYGEDQPGRNGYGHNEYGHDRYGQDAAYGQDQYGQEQYGHDPYGRGAYGQDAAYGEDPYGVRGAHGGQQHGQSYDAYAYPYEQPRADYRAAVDGLSDPLTDPLPTSDAPSAGQGEENTSPWFRPAREHGGGHGAGQQQAQPQQAPAPQQYASPQAPQRPYLQQQRQPQQQARPAAARRGPADVEETATMPALGAPDEGATETADALGTAASGGAGQAGDERRTVALRRPSEEELGGRAARRRAAAGKDRGGRRAAGAAGGAAATPSRPMTRLEARRAARAAKDGPVVLLSRAIGEVFITCGVLMLLFVAYQLWWTNILADNYAGGAKESLTQRWANNPERKPGDFSPGQGFAIMYIPKLDVVVPVAEGIDKQSVLDNGLVGHYDKESGLPTAMPWDETGNFGVAGHRNTHGEPFRYVNRLVAGDKIVVETAEKYYIYEMYSRLPSTSPSNVSVLDPVPPQSGFEKPGRYITLTTCTPEFTSKYRLIVWGRMVDERPRSEGKPDALVE